MEGQVYIALPDTALSVLELFSTSKEGIASFASKIINDVEDGNVDALKVKVFCKTLEEVADKINNGTKENQKTEAAKYGEKPFSFMGAELHLTATKTEYSYDNCNDPVLDRLLKIQEETKKQVSDRQAFLKTLPSVGEFLIDEGTGEINKVMPPLKTQSMGVKVSIK